MTTTNALPVDSANIEQLRAWDGDQGEYWADHAEYFDRAVAAYHRRLLEVATISERDHVLDVGCGTGQTTRDAARAASTGSALGVDLSSRMLAYARRRSTDKGVTNVRFVQADAQIHAFEPGAYDVAISRTGAMFFGDHGAAFRNIGRALRSGGRLALVTWQPLPGNEWIREISGAMAAGRELPVPPPDAPGPFALSDPDRVRALLTSAGFGDVELEGTSAGMWFGNDADDAHRFALGLSGWMLDGLDGPGRTRAVDALHAAMAAHETPDGVLFASAAWIIRATRP
ncbi:MAG TPA: class I SAM-dependent methyltransferase [Pseudonocardia sp.]|jgi:SAM-dependent methyltransferase|nr:class I SAM-dependent methyltransferase [Pseudonocardia sp.]